jgi:hypothetical protein
MRLTATNTAPADFESHELPERFDPSRPATEQPKTPRPEAKPAAQHVTGARSPKHCPHCGAAYRGDWDQIDTPAGVMCNICANRAGDTSIQKTYAQQQEEAAESMGPPPEVDAPPREKQTKLPVVEEDWFKKLILVAGIVVVLLGLGVYLMPPGPREPTPEELAAIEASQDAWDRDNEGSPGERRKRQLEPDFPEPAAEPEGLPAPLEHGAFWFFFLLLGIAVEWLALYVALSMVGALPNDSIFKNVIGLAPMAFVVWLFATVIPRVLPDVCCLVTVITASFVTFLMWVIFNLKVWELVQFFFVRLLIVGAYTAFLMAVIRG